MLNDLLWLVYAYLAFVSIFAVPAALVWVVRAFFKAHGATKADAEMRKLARGHLSHNSFN